MTASPDGPAPSGSERGLLPFDPPSSGLPAEEGWVSREVAAMAEAWADGRRLTADEILARWPEAAADPEAAVRLVYEEICLRREAGLVVDPDAWLRRYPEHAEALNALFECDRLLDLAEQPVAMPEVGETLGPFTLLAELGRGAAGRTFLATEASLADRPVVVKVVSDHQDEHLALARLRHTHIVPLFSEQTLPGRGLRVLCMPYLGGASLGQILDDLAATPPARRSGRLLAEVIDRNTRPRPAPPPADGPFRRMLERSAYPEAIAWVVACLADALSYAHERGLIHMDIKPSNVLITVDGQPMLLDFHLARAPIARGAVVADRLGGTPGWMSPEQEEALRAVREGRPVPAAVDGRSDIYALGLLLREGLAPGVAAGRRRDAGAGPMPSAGLVDIMRRCLAPDPDRRYRDAAALADDLRRHINALPLRGVRNRSVAERWGKWRRRHPGALAWGVTSLAILAAAIAGGGAVVARRAEQAGAVRTAMEAARALTDTGRHDEAIATLERGLRSAGPLVDASDLRAQLRRVRHLRTARQLRDLADRVRYRYGVDLPAGDEARLLVDHCRILWDRRDRLKPAPDAPADPAVEASIRTDLIEIVLVWTDILAASAAPEASASARTEALRLLDEADAAFGPSLALDDRRATLRASAGGTLAAEPPPRSAWESYDRGRARLRRGQLAEAAADFRHVLATRPDDFWSNFYDGLCAYRLGRFHDAVAAYRTCLAILPGSAVCHHDRSLALAALGRADEAYGDATRALDLDPSLAVAWLNRASLALAARRPASAAADLERALQLPGVDRATMGRLHDHLARARLGQGDVAGARREAEAAVALGCLDARPLLDARPPARPVAHP